MDMLPGDLTAAALGARERLTAYSYKTAAVNAGGDPVSAQAAMVGAAREAIFADALLQALHARLEELKSVTK